MEGDRCDALYEKGDTIDETITEEGDDGHVRFEGKRNDSVTIEVCDTEGNDSDLDVDAFESLDQVVVIEELGQSRDFKGGGHLSLWFVRRNSGKGENGRGGRKRDGTNCVSSQAANELGRGKE